MIDRVVWLDLAIEQLGEIWMESQTRSEVTKAVTQLERDLLLRQAAGVMSISEGLFRYNCPPLKVYFSLNLSAR